MGQDIREIPARLLSSAMLGVRGRIQREGEVVHLVAHELTDLSAELASVGTREAPFPLPHGRGDEAHQGAPGVDLRSLPQGRNIVDPYEHIDRIKVKTRDFRYKLQGIYRHHVVVWPA